MRGQMARPSSSSAAAPTSSRSAAASAASPRSARSRAWRPSTTGGASARRFARSTASATRPCPARARVAGGTTGPRTAPAAGPIRVPDPATPRCGLVTSKAGATTRHHPSGRSARVAQSAPPPPPPGQGGPIPGGAIPPGGGAGGAGGTEAARLRARLARREKRDRGGSARRPDRDQRRGRHDDRRRKGRHVLAVGENAPDRRRFIRSRVAAVAHRVRHRARGARRRRIRGPMVPPPPRYLTLGCRHSRRRRTSRRNQTRRVTLREQGDQSRAPASRSAWCSPRRRSGSATGSTGTTSPR